LEENVLPHYPVEILIGKKNLEVRPRFINKGEIVKRLLASNPHVDFVFCAGDDKTDEDMFRALNNSSLPKSAIISVAIGEAEKSTLANWHVGEPTDIIRTLGEMAKISNTAVDLEEEDISQKTQTEVQGTHALKSIPVKVPKQEAKNGCMGWLLGCICCTTLVDDNAGVHY
jgi:hypothetical protein